MPWSNCGEHVKVCTNGDRILSDYFDAKITFKLPGKHQLTKRFYGGAAWSGTSFAAPSVAGLIAAKMAELNISAREAVHEVLEARPTVTTIVGTNRRLYGRWVVTS